LNTDTLESMARNAVYGYMRLIEELGINPRKNFYFKDN